MQKSPQFVSSTKAAADIIFNKIGAQLRLATPLGLGKPNFLLNELYDRTVENAGLNLKIYTALSLQPPEASSDLARRFFEQFSKRHWGENYPVLKYFRAAARGQLPKNIEVHEFYFQAGAALKKSQLQRNYQSVNYTHVTENLLREDINVVVKLIASQGSGSEQRFSLSSNPDLSLDLVDLYKAAGKKLFMVGVVHPGLPFLEGEPEVKSDFFDIILDDPTLNHQLFALPRMPISPEDHFIGFHASQLVQDGGTIQIGIGSLSDAIVNALRVRQEFNGAYKKICQQLSSAVSFQDVFATGLYGLTEMLTDGFMHLRKARILKREVIDEATQARTYVHGAFFLGSKEFYQWLRALPVWDKPGLRMSRISKVNDLYDPNEILLRKQRHKACFFNTTMQVSLLGEAASETLHDAQVVSGVGGQYNFVAMAHELKDARSVLMLRSTRLDKEGQRVSNIQLSLEHLTIPRHLRDVVVTEYGLAFLRGQTDEECIIAMIQIADSAYQDELIANAQKAGKLREDFKLDSKYGSNTPAKIAALMKASDFKEIFKPFPFGSDFTSEEEKIVLALQQLQDDQKAAKLKLVKALLKPLPSDAKEKYAGELKRMGLDASKTLRARIYRRLLLQYLEKTTH